jgi:hypothetical protein
VSIAVPEIQKELGLTSTLTSTGVQWAVDELAGESPGG